jgi:hypothetical protein
MCHQVPIVEIVPTSKEPVLYSHVKPEDVPAMIDAHFRPSGFLKNMERKLGKLIDTVQNDDHWQGIDRYELDVRDKPVSQFLGKQIPIATEHRGVINPLNFDEYVSHGGFDGLERAKSLTPVEVITEVRDSGLGGRGGAGFPTGIKWDLVAKQHADIKYLICNGDEGDPGLSWTECYLNPIRLG